MTSHRSTNAIAIALTLVLAGCGKPASDSAAELAIKTVSGGKVDVTTSGDKSQVTIKTDQGEAHISAGGNLALPKDFPSDLHLPLFAYTISNVVQMGPATVVTMHSAAPVATLFAEYDSTMKAAGWTEATAVQSTDAASVLTFQKDNRVASVTLEKSSDQGGGTDISLQHSAQK